MKKLFLGAVLAAIISISLVKLAQAYLLDQETSTGNLVSGATISLQVGADDPSTWGFQFADIIPGQIHEVMVPIVSSGSIPGNFWLEVAVSDSEEGDNPSSETEITGEGDLDDCSEIAIDFVSDDGSQYLSMLNWTPVNEVVPQDIDGGSLIDDLVRAGNGQMDLMLRTDQCGLESMGDFYYLDFIFHLDQ